MPRLPVFLAVLLSAIILRAHALPSGDTLEIHFFAKVYSSPSDVSPLLGITGDGTRLEVKERRPGWMAVTFAGTTGWIPMAPAAPAEVPRSSAARKPSNGPGLSRHLLVASLPVLLFLAGLGAWGLWSSRRRNRRLVEPAGAGVKARNCVLEGTITRDSLAEILQFLEIGRRTGLLSLEDPQPAGLIAFEDGDIILARTRTLEGPDAVFEILALDAGTFRFYADKPAGQGNLRISATQILLQWARKVDESGEMTAVIP